jgi:hypothetical protein
VAKTAPINARVISAAKMAIFSFLIESPKISCRADT